MRSTVFAVLILVLASAALADPHGVADSPHNLSVVGRGQKPASEQEICIACHTPHVTESVRPIWDADLKPAKAKLFQASSTDAHRGQPTGASKMCLSCHDGIIAPGNIVSRGQAIQAADTLTTLSHRKPRPGTDLADDHPISFRFDAALMSKDAMLKDPRSLTGQVKLDAGGEMQCTSCHDPHDSANGKFLVATAANSILCNNCHQAGVTSVTHHMECLGCHQNHTAPSGTRLLKQATITNTCLTCHAGGTTAPQGPNVGDDIRKFANHDTNPPIDLAKHAPGDAACTDCHEPHTMKTATASAPMIRGNFGDAAGISAAGMPVKPARYEYEVCFRCHGDRQDLEPRITRAIRQTNFRLMFSTSSASFHPVEGRGMNTSVPSLKTGITPASTIYCTDCHSSDSGKKAGGSGASGPHGSETAGLLLDRYDTTDFSSESSQTYALCYRCHERNSILSDESFKLHKRHVVDDHTPCSACHDPHGISSTQGSAQHNSHLINFDVRIVRKSSAGKREFNTTGIRKGNCTLNCHGVEHFSFSY